MSYGLGDLGIAMENPNQPSVLQRAMMAAGRAIDLLPKPPSAPKPVAPAKPVKTAKPVKVSATPVSTAKPPVVIAKPVTVVDVAPPVTATSKPHMTQSSTAGGANGGGPTTLPPFPAIISTPTGGGETSFAVPASSPSVSEPVVTTSGAMPSWIMPVGVAALAFLFLRGKR